MRIGVVSDTHLPRFGRRLPDALRRGLIEANVQLILHLGDFTGPGVPGLFEEIAALEAVAGNNDGPDLVARFGRAKLIEIEGARLGLVHGDQGRGANAIGRARQAYPDEPLDALLFGHSHIPHHSVEIVAGRPRLLLNPGSPTDKRRQPEFSYALLEIGEGRLSAELVTYRDRAARSVAAPR